MVKFTNIYIKCPKCGKNGIIEVSNDDLKNNLRGILAINIVEGNICSHSFIIYIDKNFNIRDYFVADFQLELPETKLEDLQLLSAPEKEVLDIDLIKLNITATLLTYIIKSIFLKKKIVLISEYEFLYDQFLNFFNYITRDSFEADISLISKESYKKEKKLYKDAMVFEGSKIINNSNSIINPKKLSVERYIINKFLTINDLGFSYIILKNELQKAYNLAMEIIKYNENLKENQELTSKRIIDHFMNTYNIKIDIHYLTWLLDIIKTYFNVDLSIKSSVSNFLGY